jgi:hypothetical protein
MKTEPEYGIEGRRLGRKFTWTAARVGRFTAIEEV